MAHISPDLTIPLTPFNKSLGPCTSLPKPWLIFCLRKPCWEGACARTSYHDNVIGGLSLNGDIPGPEFTKNSGNSGLTKSPLPWFCEPSDWYRRFLNGSSSSTISL